MPPRRIVQVVGGVDEVVGQFPIASVQSLNVNGLAANDSFHVDPKLSLPVGFNGEGEVSQPASSQQSTHQHGSATTIAAPAVTSATALSPLAENQNQILSRSPAAASIESERSDFVVCLHFNHSTNRSGPDRCPRFACELCRNHADSHHALKSCRVHQLLAARWSLNPTSPGHHHAAVYFTAGAASVISALVNHDSSSPATLETTIASDEHDRHTETKSTSESPSKLIPKRCTVTASGGVLITSVDGKRQCDCDAKSKAAQEVKEQLAGEVPTAIRLAAPRQTGRLPALPAILVGWPRRRLRDLQFRAE